MSETPTVPEAIDHLESFVEGQLYMVGPSIRTASRVVLDELSRVQAELQKAAGEIVMLREQGATGLTLTIDQIKDLAEFAGPRVEGEITDEDKETEITITICPKQGIKEDDGSIVHYQHIAYLEEYPEEGVCPLGKRLVLPQ